MRDSVRFTTQPVDEVHESKRLVDVLASVDAEELLMFSTDYPHWDFDSPDRALPPQLPDDVRRGILHDNAAALYDLSAAPVRATPLARG